jgi:cellulose synthase operon protein C
MRGLWLTCWCCVAAFGALAQPSDNAIDNPIVSKAREKAESLEKLKRDLFKIDRSLGETDKLIAKSRNAPYLPELQFRQAELYVEKSRTVYTLQVEQRPESQKGALVSPETKLLKQKAIQIYTRILREFPDFKDADKVTFYLAHEERELGEFETMLKTHEELIRKFPSSPLRLDSLQILGDHYFDKGDLKQAEERYKLILESPPSPVHDLARYKMGWIRVNQANHADAVTFFEAAAASQPLPGVDAAKALNVKREALLDLVYSYTEARPGKGSIQYFERLSDSRATLALALDKLGNRYFIKQQYEFAIPALRKVLEIQPDPEQEFERVGKLYDAIKAAKGKAQPKPEDVAFCVRAAAAIKKDSSRDEPSRKKTLNELEEMARDLSTTIHVAAQKRDDLPLYTEAASAYKNYLSLFRPKQYVSVMMQNRADALYSARQFPDAARQFEQLAQTLDGSKDATAKTASGLIDKAALKDSKLSAVAGLSKEGTKTLSAAKGHGEALYGALVSHFAALKPGEVERLTAFEVADARSALKLLGAQFIARYPKDEHALEVKFNIARANYEDGDYKRSAELFKEFALNHPDHKDAAAAGSLAFDSLRQLNDFKSIDTYGKAFLLSQLPASFKADVNKILTQSKSDALGELALKSSQETGDVMIGLLKVADENKGQEIGEKALYGAFAASREKRDGRQEREIGERFIKEYPKSQYLSDVMVTVARHAAEAGRFEDAANAFEQMGRTFESDATGTDSLLSAAKLKLALGDKAGALKVLESAAEKAGARRVEVLTLIAQTQLKNGQPAKARAVAEQVLKLDKSNASAAAVVAEVVASQPLSQEKTEALANLLTPVTQGPNASSEDSAKALWFYGDMLYRQMKALPASDIENKVAQLKQMQGVLTQAAQMGSAEWAVASLWRIGGGFAHLADVVEATPVPKELTKPQDVDQFRQAVKSQVEPLKEQADNAYQTCLSRAESLEVFSAAVVGCRKKVDTASLPIKSPAGERAANVDELRRKAESSLAAKDFEALGMAYLQANQLGNATLHFNRAAEIDDSRASVHNAMGVALLLSGDANAARAEYGKALDADPTFEKARVNIAALKCRFGDADGAKRDLAVVKDTSGLVDADVDSEWKSCK